MYMKKLSKKLLLRNGVKDVLTCEQVDAVLANLSDIIYEEKIRKELSSSLYLLIDNGERRANAKSKHV